MDKNSGSSDKPVKELVYAALQLTPEQQQQVLKKLQEMHKVEQSMRACSPTMNAGDLMNNVFESSTGKEIINDMSSLLISGLAPTKLVQSPNSAFTRVIPKKKVDLNRRSYGKK